MDFEMPKSDCSQTALTTPPMAKVLAMALVSEQVYGARVGDGVYIGVEGMNLHFGGWGKPAQVGMMNGFGNAPAMFTNYNHKFGDVPWHVSRSTTTLVNSQREAVQSKTTERR
ncbi:hypothetical protein IFR05_000507 [Cadophora sp. M221]|nr:hypothetical protein IFR05_000507 [Cadophora sp. M221]